jgi:hypothetical protein
MSAPTRASPISSGKAWRSCCLHAAIVEAGVDPLVGLERRRYRVRDEEVTAEQFVVADPDGYLLRFLTDRP